ncbi:MAG: polysaccharide deacetylase family protein [bacterium]
MPLDIIDAALKNTIKTSVEVTLNGRTDIMSIDGEEQKYEIATFLHRVYKRIPFEKQSAFLDEVASKTGFSSPDAIPSLGSHVSCMTWDHLREMIHGGMEIGSHTHRHIILAKSGDEHVDYELSQSKMLLEKNLGQPCPLFCYPNGHYPESGNDFTNSIVKKAGYSCATFMCGGINHPWTDPYFIARRAVGLFTTMTGLRITLTSLGPRMKTIFGEDPSPHAVSLRLIKAQNREDDLLL